MGQLFSESKELSYLLMMVLPLVGLFGAVFVQLWWQHRKGAERDEQ